MNDLLNILGNKIVFIYHYYTQSHYRESVGLTLVQVKLDFSIAIEVKLRSYYC